MPDLSADVRDRAAQAAYAATAIGPYPGWTDLKEEWREQMRREADAVAAVVLSEEVRHEVECPSCGATIRASMADAVPEVIALRDRITELEAQVKALEPALRELLDQTHMGNEATDMAWKQHNARHALMFMDGDPRA